MKSATKSFLESKAGFDEFIYCAVDALRKSTEPLDQSIAAAIVIFYYDRLESPLDLLETLYESPYLQIRDTIGRLATDLFDHTDKKTREFARHVSSIYYEPYDCEVDSNGYIVVKPEAAGNLWEGVRIYTPEDQWNAWSWIIGIDISDKPELLALFKKCVVSRNYLSVLNPFERHHFVDWLTDQDSGVSDEDVVTLLDDLSLDPIAFVRSRVAHRIGRWVGDPGFERTFQTLCYDSSPFVKIEALEEVIVPNWVDQTEDGRGYLLDLVVDRDPFIIDQVLTKASTLRREQANSGR